MPTDSQSNHHQHWFCVQKTLTLNSWYWTERKQYEREIKQRILISTQSSWALTLITAAVEVGGGGCSLVYVRAQVRMWKGRVAKYQKNGCPFSLQEIRLRLLWHDACQKSSWLEDFAVFFGSSRKFRVIISSPQIILSKLWNVTQNVQHVTNRCVYLVSTKPVLVFDSHFVENNCRKKKVPSVKSMSY